ncbi:MAG: hypothetical protein IT367_08910 [Candidatus Hydrogenedentes bacterium]|nr:hypothetical protein [Candidatus Hydrogenedentota bacterium]
MNSSAINKYERLETLGLLLLLALATSITAFASDTFEEEPIRYGANSGNNDVTNLQSALDSSSTEIAFDAKFGRLPSVLEHLKVPRESQVLVFSKTSLQIQHISPSNPRAIYFNDDTYVGSVPNGDVIEVSTADPQLGAMFYTVSQRETERGGFIRQKDNCLQCHGSSLTHGIPGHIVRSVFSDEDGYPILKAGTHLTGQSSPMLERWGGWYVTGTHGAARHMGNVLAVETELDASVDRDAGANLSTLHARVDTERYLTAHSDIVALLVLAHQVEVHNLITEANFDTRAAQYRQAAVDEVLKRDPNVPSESTLHVVKSAGDELIESLLFANEAKLSSPIKGTSGFTEMFLARGPRDAQGRSLRDFDLQTRMFKYPLSYLIYSKSFDGLPELMKKYVYQSLWDHLTGRVESRFNAHLSAETRAAILQIVRETKENLPDYWK